MHAQHVIEISAVEVHHGQQHVGRAERVRTAVGGDAQRVLGYGRDDVLGAPSRPIGALSVGAAAMVRVGTAEMRASRQTALN